MKSVAITLDERELMRLEAILMDQYAGERLPARRSWSTSDGPCNYGTRWLRMRPPLERLPFFGARR